MNTKIVERSILHYTNKERRHKGLRPLKPHGSLIKAARGHSRWMAATGRFQHRGVKGTEPWDRTKYHGFYGSASENIWQSSGNVGLAWQSRFRWDNDWKLGKAAVISWMNSPGHRANLLGDWDSIGIGVARRRGRIFLTQNFGISANPAGIDISFAVGIACFVAMTLIIFGIGFLLRIVL